MARPFVIKRNDLSRSLKYYPKANPASDFSGATVLFKMRYKGGSAKISAGAVTVSSDTGGTYFQYDWVLGDTDTAGDFEGEFEATLASTKPETYPNRGFIPVEIGEDVS